MDFYINLITSEISAFSDGRAVFLELRISVGLKTFHPPLYECYLDTYEGRFPLQDTI